MNTNTAIFAVIIAAVIAFVLRVLPFALFSTKKTPEAITYLGRVLPPAIMGMLVVYCLKGVSFSTVSGFVPELIASVIVIGMHIWKKNTLLSIAVGTVVYMVLVQTVFVN